MPSKTVTTAPIEGRIAKCRCERLLGNEGKRGRERLLGHKNARIVESLRPHPDAFETFRQVVQDRRIPLDVE